jgi:hypothetical protein
VTVRQKIIAAAIAMTLGSFAAVGAFASQDAVDLGAAAHLLSGGVLGVEVTPDPALTPTDTATVEPTSTETVVATETSTPEATTTGTPEATSTADPSETPEATETAEDDADSEDENDNDVHGIPTTNPSHHPEDGDGECEKGETVVKTTPSGTQVNVPCQAAGEHGNGKHGDSHDATPENSTDNSGSGDNQEQEQEHD